MFIRHGHSEWNQLQHGLATMNFHHRTHNLKTHDVECQTIMILSYSYHYSDD